MSHNALAIIIGGLIPAVGLGIFAVLQKTASNAGISVGPYLIATSLGVLATGLASLFVLPEKIINTTSAAIATLTGVVWAISIGAIMIALNRYSAQISKLVPIYSTNALIAVILGLIIFAEYNNLNPTKLIAATILIIIGASLAASA